MNQLPWYPCVPLLTYDSALRTSLDTAHDEQDTPEQTLCCQEEHQCYRVHSRKTRLQKIEHAQLNVSTYAIACPSEVDVHRPSSSKATREFLVADD
jgi:hypothetical protein